MDGTNKQAKTAVNEAKERRKELDRETVRAMKTAFLEAAAGVEASPRLYRKALFLAALEAGKHVKMAAPVKVVDPA